MKIGEEIKLKEPTVKDLLEVLNTLPSEVPISTHAMAGISVRYGHAYNSDKGHVSLVGIQRFE